MRVILVPLAGDDDDRIGLAAACTVAGPFGAHVDAIFLRPDPFEAIVSLEDEATPELVDTVTQAASAAWNGRAKLARQAFDAAQAAAGATLAEQPGGDGGVTANWREIVGAPGSVLATEGRLSDLIVLAGVHSGGSARRRRMFEAALLHAARPLLLVPEAVATGGAPSIGRIVAVAWNGSAEATRALAGALPLLRHAGQVHVLTAASARTEIESAEALERYLAWHGLGCQRHPLYPSGQVGPALMAKAHEVGADLLVMGGYGRSRLSELAFGGVTRTVLGQYDLPILLAH